MNTELGLRIAGPDVRPEEVDGLIAFLRGKGWMKAVEIAAAAGVSERKMRAIAEHSEGRILSGQAGYRYLDQSVPIEEVDRAATWLESQGKKMLVRGAEIRRRYHRFAREQEPVA
jgi:hypothetical protein